MTNREHDHPLSCHWRPVSPDAYDFLGLPQPRSGKAARARAQVLTEAFVVGRAHPDEWVSYSRRQAFYAARQGSRYWPETYSYHTIVPAVDQFAAAGILEHERMPPGSLGRQSRFRMTAEAIGRLSERPLVIIHDPRELVVLRDRGGCLIDYVDTRRSGSIRMRRNVEVINEVIASVPIGLRGSIIRDGDLLQVGKANVGAASSTLYRVFNREFSYGGRLYGGWWQNIPSGRRADITIGGAETVEIDYRALHPSMLYSLAGKPMEGDPYDLAGWPRALVKVAFNTLINAESRQAAIRSIANEIGGEGAHAKARALVREIEAKHAPIAHMFGSGAGLRLQRRDSDLAEAILLRLAAQGVVTLPIHDSFIVPDRDNGFLVEVMADELQKLVNHNRGTSTTCPKTVPQYGTQPLPSGAPSRLPLGLVCLFFPDLAQRDLFGAHRLGVPAAAVLGWSGGIAPPEVRTALRREARRRGHRRADVAARIGISRPQLENIIAGRFGASSEVASRIRDFLIEGAATVGASAA